MVHVGVYIICILSPINNNCATCFSGRKSIRIHHHTGQCKLTGGLRHSTEISCADSKSDLCAVYKNSECCGEAVPATMAHLGNNQRVVSMRKKMLPVRCNEIPQKIIC